MSKKKQREMREALARELQVFLHRVLYRVQLAPKEKRQLREDFLRLFEFYQAQGLTIEESTARIGDDILGDFYVPPKPDDWYALDSAAKVYPLSITQTRMTVFRMSAYMTAPVEPCVLQIALLSVIKRFPFFATTAKRGFFWHYLDATRRRFAVREEADPPCSYIDLRFDRSPCFQVLYYKNRISVEMFHALTDGTGAMVFLKTLVREYLRLLGHEIPYGNGILDVSETPRCEERRNAFTAADRAAKGGGFMQSLALQPGAKKRKTYPARIIHFVLPADRLLAVARAHNTTITCLLVTAMFMALKPCIDFAKPEDALHIQVPVNMRKFYGAETLRNFSMYATLSVPYGADMNFDTLLQSVATQLSDATAKPELDKMVASTDNLVSNPFMCIVPLWLKNIVLKNVYGFLGEKVLSSTLSNIGVVQNDFGEYVDMFDFVLGPSSMNNSKCTLVTYRNKAVFTITESVANKIYERTFWKVLTELGIESTVEGNKA